MEKVKREKLVVKIICVAFAVILWFYVSFFENPVMTTTVSDVPVGITEEQLDRLNEKGLSVYSISEKSIDVKATAPRLTLATQTRKNLTAYLNISSVNKSGTYYLPVTVSSRDNSNATYTIKNRNIKVVIEPILTGAFTLEADINSSFVGYDTFSLGTETVIISAPESVYNKIGAVKTEPINIDGRIDTKTRWIILYDQEGNVIERDDIICSPDSVELQFSYLDEKAVPVVLKTIDGKTFALPSEYDVVIYGDTEKLNTVTKIETISFDLGPHDKDSMAKVKLNLPDGIKVSDNNKEFEIALSSVIFK